VAATVKFVLPEGQSVVLPGLPVMAGAVLTVIVAVLPLDTVLLQPVDWFWIEVIVMVGEPAVAKADVLNVPVPLANTIVAVLPVTGSGELRLYVTVYVAAARLDEVTVTVEAKPAQAAAAEVLKLLTLGDVFTIRVAAVELTFPQLFDTLHSY